MRINAKYSHSGFLEHITNSLIIYRTSLICFLDRKSKAFEAKQSNLEAAMKSIDASKNKVSRRKQAERYEQWCCDHNRSAYPAKFDSVGVFLIDFVLKQKGSAKSLEKVVYAIKKASLIRKVAFLPDEVDQDRLRDLIRSLRQKIHLLLGELGL